MKILNFNGSKIHGYLDFKIKFNDDITFLTGINGSGKTTVVQSIASLISASIYSLATTKYKMMEVIINYNGKRVKIKSSKDSQQMIIESSEVNKELKIPLYPAETGGMDYREREREIEFYKEEDRITDIRKRLLRKYSTEDISNLEIKFKKYLKNCKKEKFISGKDYLLPLIHRHLKHKVKYKGDSNQLKCHLARHCELDVDSMLYHRIKKLAN